MKEIVAFLLVLMIIFGSTVITNAPGVELKIKEKSEPKIQIGDALPPATPTPIPLPEHIWSPALGTSYENRMLGGRSDSFDISQAQIFLVFAYRNMEDNIPCTIAVFRGEESNGEMNWPMV